jgi:hypothetical protein
MTVKADVDYLLTIAAFLARGVRKLSHTEAVERRAIRQASSALHFLMAPPRHSDSGLVYVELLRHSSIVVHLELVFGPRGMSGGGGGGVGEGGSGGGGGWMSEFDDLGDDEQLGVALFGGPLWSMLQVVGGSVAHVSPTFQFNELIVRHSFGQRRELAKTIAMSLVRQVKQREGW